MPEGPWVMTQTWHDLLFAHWPVDAAAVRERVPASFELDLFDGRAWLGVVPFHMTNVAPRFVPALPWVSAFPELNVRTYVRVGDKPGVFFFSLDAGNPVAVGAAKTLLNLPYYTADMAVTSGQTIRYSSRRLADPQPHFQAAYRGLGDRRPPARGTLEYFLTERYCLYAIDRRGGAHICEIHHARWPLQVASARFEVNTLLQGIVDVDPLAPALLHFSKRQDTINWRPGRV